MYFELTTSNLEASLLSSVSKATLRSNSKPTQPTTIFYSNSLVNYFSRTLISRIHGIREIPGI